MIYCKTVFGPEIIFHWDSQFPETVKRLRSAGLLSQAADAATDRCVETLVDLLDGGVQATAALEAVSTAAFTKEPAIPELRPVALDNKPNGKRTAL